MGLATVLLTALVTASDVRISGSASPPAELVSVITEIGDSSDASISSDGALIAFDFSDQARNGATRLAKVRNRNVPLTEPMPFLTANVANQSAGVISRDGCHLAHLSTIALGGYRGQVVVVSNRCTGAPPIQIAQQSRSQARLSWQDLVISARGRYVALSDAVSGVVLWLDRDSDQNGTLDDTAVVARTTDAPAATPSLGDETLTNLVALTSSTAAGTQVYRWNPMLPFSTGSSIVSASNGTSTPMTGVLSLWPSMTPDGRYVAFEVATPGPVGTVFIPGLSQVMVRDTATNRTVLVSRNANGAGGNGSSARPSISADGTQIAFGTAANDLLAPGVGGRVNGGRPSLDLLVAVSTSGLFDAVSFDRVSLTPSGTAIDPKNGLMAMHRPVISSNGRFVAFESTFAAELRTGGTTDTSGEIFVSFLTDIYVIGRPAALSVTALDFGQITLGTTSAPQPATVTNTGISSVLPGAITAGGEFAIVGGGSCAVGAWISPGQSCTVSVQFTPAAAGNRSANLTIAESGFAAVSGSGALRGAGFSPPGPTNGTTTSSSMPITETTPPADTTPPTVARVPQLVITPDPASFGMMMVGVSAAPVVFSVTSTGTAFAPVTSVSVNGSTDFVVTDNGCQGASLAPGASCAVTVVYTPSAVGPAAAILTAGSPDASATAALSGEGTLQPMLRLLPDVIGLGGVGIAVGAGFVPNMSVQLQWDGSSGMIAATTDATGALEVQIPIRLDDVTGPRTLRAVDQPGLFTGISTPALIVPGSAHPPTSPNPALPGLASLVVR